MVDEEEAYRSVGGFECQAQLGFERVAEGCSVVGDGLISAAIVHPGQREVVKSGEAGLIDDGTRHSGESGHGRDGGSQEREGNGPATEVLTGSGGWNVRDDTAEGRKIAHGSRSCGRVRCGR